MRDMCITKSKKYAMGTTIDLSNFESFMFRNLLIKAYLINAAELYKYTNQIDLGEDDDKRAYGSECEELDKLKYLRYIHGKCIVL